MNHPIDELMLQIFFVITALAIAISNGVLLWTLFKKRNKIRAVKIFATLSCSDIGVGILSISLV